MNIEINTQKRTEECVREGTSHLTTLKSDTEIGMAEKVQPWDQANRRQKLDLVWRNRQKISQIINAYLYLPLFLLIILCSGLSGRVVHFKQFIMC